MKSSKVLVGIGITLAAIVVIHYIRTRKITEKKRIHIANEGYETAEDVLYPNRKTLGFS